MDQPEDKQKVYAGICIDGPLAGKYMVSSEESHDDSYSAEYGYTHFDVMLWDRTVGLWLHSSITITGDLNGFVVSALLNAYIEVNTSEKRDKKEW